MSIAKHKNGSGVDPQDVLARAAANAIAGGAVGRPLADRGKRREIDREAFSDWLRAESDPARKSYRCVRYILFHVTKDADEKGCSSFQIPKEATDRESLIAACVDKFGKTSRTLADAAGAGLHHFYVASYRTESNEDEQPQDQHHFVTTASEETLSLGGAAFGGVGSANEALGHSMRLFDTLIRSNAELMRTNADRYLEQLSAQNTLIADLTTRSLQQTVELQEALDRKALRDVEVQHKIMRLDAEFKAYGAAISYLLPLATHVLSKKTGFDPKQAAAAGAEAQILSAAKTLKPAQLAALVLTFDEEQQAAFGPVVLQLVAEWSPERRGEFQEAMASYQAPRPPELPAESPKPPKGDE